jgi:hypothetical protein
MTLKKLHQVTSATTNKLNISDSTETTLVSISNTSNASVSIDDTAVSNALMPISNTSETTVHTGSIELVVQMPNIPSPEDQDIDKNSLAVAQDENDENSNGQGSSFDMEAYINFEPHYTHTETKPVEMDEQSLRGTPY